MKLQSAECRVQRAGCRVQIGAALVLTVLAGAGAMPRAQDNDARRRGYDDILDLYVRDGLVYYRALRSDRSRLDAYVSSLAPASLDTASREEQMAFWLNAYNAIVLKTVVDHYPIPQRTREYPPRSIRQIPGAFERTSHRVAGKTVTLDQIEQTVLAAFQDPRMYLALGRGALGGGRLRSEAYTGASIERQLTETANDCVNRAQCAEIDRTANLVKLNAVFSWREKDFVARYADKAHERFGTRSPLERAALAFLDPKLVTTEREFLEKNMFAVAFIPFDWNLNDLTGRGGR